jgi:archaellum component FlaF (FlaF/FlaG flagellin family)
VTTDLPVVVELPSYFVIPKNGTHGAFASGNDEVGAAAPQISWDFAEGYTGTSTNQFLTYLDLANPGDTAANVTLTLAVTNGTTPLAPVTKQYSVPPQSSITIWLNTLVCPQGMLYCGYSIGTHVAASQPIVVDRQMLFDYQGTIPGSTAVVGSQGPQPVFYFAEGYTGAGFNEYLTIVNPATNSSAEMVTIRYLIQGSTPKTVTLPQALQPGQRWTEIVNRDVGANQQLSAQVTANAGTLIVERPMYFDFHSFAFGGTDVIGYSPGN